MWTHEKILLLISTYREQQEKMKSGKMLLRKMWKQVSEHTKKIGYDIPPNKCTSKMDSLKRRYRKIIDHNKYFRQKRDLEYFRQKRDWNIFSKKGTWNNFAKKGTWNIFSKKGTWNNFYKKGTWNIFSKKGTWNIFSKKGTWMNFAKKGTWNNFEEKGLGIILPKRNLEYFHWKRT
ncbi:Transcription elongation factor spt5 [Cyphomyrmex costatus]|uniref:Transcription elongation factor spt5 n=1 Tax=Cyphomyrmex costatus TaxID=456900 RepID=A0A151I878_9HYME|nr:Transcription elongation factor spt5 [Cyphomyrmex costatus]